MAKIVMGEEYEDGAPFEKPAPPKPVNGAVDTGPKTPRSLALREIAKAERDFKAFLGKLGKSRETAIALQRFEEACAWMIKHSVKHMT